MFSLASVILFGGVRDKVGGACMAKKGMHGEGQCAWQRGACMAKGGHAWQRGTFVVKGGVRGRRGGHFSRRYAPYLNAFLFMEWFYSCVTDYLTDKLFNFGNPQTMCIRKHSCRITTCLNKVKWGWWGVSMYSLCTSRTNLNISGGVNVFCCIQIMYFHDFSNITKFALRFKSSNETSLYF